MKLSDNGKKIITFIIKNPGLPFAQIAEGLALPKSSVKKAISNLEDAGYVRYVSAPSRHGSPTKLWHANGRVINLADQIDVQEREPATEETPLPMPTAVEKSTAEKKRDLLKSLTPRELMLELRSRGYSGKLRYVHIIDIDNL